MTTVAGFDVDELAAQLILHAVAGHPDRRHNIVDIGPRVDPTDHHDTPND